MVSSSLHSSSFSCSLCAVSATILRTLLPSGIMIGSIPKLTFGINEVISRLHSILQSERTRCSFTAWQADEHFLTWCCYSQFDRQLIPQRQHGDTTQYSIHNSQTALQLPPVTTPYSSVHSLSSLCSMILTHLPEFYLVSWTSSQMKFSIHCSSGGRYLLTSDCTHATSVLPGTYHFSCMSCGFPGLPQSCKHNTLIHITEVGTNENNGYGIHTLMGR